MKRLHLDFAEIEGWQVSVTVDAHSKWIKAVPDELFLRRRLRTRFALLSPSLSPRVEKWQQKQKATHDDKKPPSAFMKGEKVLVLDN